MDRRIALLIDGGFFLKRLRSLLPPDRWETPEGIVKIVGQVSRSHVKLLTGVPDEDRRWHRHLYRTFYYDAHPYDGKAHHPIDNRPIDFGRSDVARFRMQLFDALRRRPKLALRLGKVNKDSDWGIDPRHTKRVLRSRDLVKALDALGPVQTSGPQTLHLTEGQAEQLRQLRELWRSIEADTVQLGLRQKGVDMRIGLDISTLTLKKQVDTIILIAGDSDFVPAAKLARREGIQFVLDPLWQKVNDDLYEHIDTLQSGLPKPGATTADSPTADA